MSQVFFYFHDSLNDFLPRQRRAAWIPVQYQGRQSAKHLAEAMGVPHPEIGRIEVGGSQAELGYLVQDGDHLSIFPYSACSRPGETSPRFILDLHLGKLAIYLRIMGFDTLYRNDYDDPQLAELAAQTNRILLTRDRRLLMRKVIQEGYCVRSLEPQEQAREVLRRYGLVKDIRPFQRCLRCNHPLQSIPKSDVLQRLEPLTRQYYDEFHICPACNHIYWKGSHFDHMQVFLDQLTKNG